MTSVALGLISWTCLIGQVQGQDAETLMQTRILHDRVNHSTTPEAIPLAALPHQPTSTCYMDGDFLTVAPGGSCLLGRENGDYLNVDYTQATYTKYEFMAKVVGDRTDNNNIHPHFGFKVCNLDNAASSRGRSPEMWYIDRNGDWGYGLYNGGWGHSALYKDRSYYGPADPSDDGARKWEVIMEWTGQQYKIYSWHVEGVSFDDYRGKVSGCPATIGNNAFTPRLWSYGGGTTYGIKDFKVCHTNDLTTCEASEAAAPMEVAGAFGDPHCVNAAGEWFDIHKIGRVPMVILPRGAVPEDADFAVVANTMSPDGWDKCAPSFINSVQVLLNKTGDWVVIEAGQSQALEVEESNPNTGAYRLEIGSDDVIMRKDPLAMKVILNKVPGSDQSHFAYLDIELTGLKSLNAGGILGADSHDFAMDRPDGCDSTAMKKSKGVASSAKAM